MTQADFTPPEQDAGTAAGAGVNRSHAERQRQLAVLHGIAGHQLRQLHAGRLPWASFLDLAHRHGRHGFTNALLINAQEAAATDVRRYDDWKDQGRQVRKGERGIRIISRRDVPYSVFDIAQTDGPASTTPPVPSVAASEALQRLLELAGDLNVYVDRGRWSYLGRPDRRISLPGEVDDGLATAILAHQLAHILQRGEHPDPQDNTPCRGARRVRADSIAYLTLAHLGADTSELRFPPVPTWAGTDERAHPLAAVEAMGTRIVRTAQRIRQRLPLRPTTDTPPLATRQAAPTKAPSPQREELIEALAQAQQFFRKHLAASWGPAYLAERGIPDGTLDAWAIGYAPARGLVEHLKSLGFTKTALHEAGLTRNASAGSHPLFVDRVSFPLRTPDGTIVGFIARRRDTGRGPKYLNTPATSLFDKSQNLFGLAHGRERLASGARPLIVEGPLDVLAISAADLDEYVPLAPCGTAITAHQLQHLDRHADLNTQGLLLALDGDKPGRRAMLRAWKELQQVKGPVDAIVLPKGQDPADILRYQGPTGVRDSLRSVTTLADLVVDAEIQRVGGTLEHAETRVAAARAAATLIAQVSAEQITRQIPRIATATGVPGATVTALIADAISPDIPATAVPEYTGTSATSPPAPPFRPPRRHAR
ncbi:toprim domain-containing protein [Actinomadura rupiterrae]|uniref:toprim domain-containing protein n=1 Tax=Actinomadura rupiterrae TaxID=559627 RepID=UPI0020A27832|nr:toprim domain-containing protein [Actinomadura rupiterrae]MCP2337936.1 DNA primase [Actinomadura rupiterrae]